MKLMKQKQTKTMQRTNAMEIWFFGKINKIDRLLVRLIKRERRKRERERVTKLIKVVMKKGTLQSTLKKIRDSSDIL